MLGLNILGYLKTFEDAYVYAEQGDRFDTLALQYYGNSEHWWVISIANEDLRARFILLTLKPTN